MTLRELSAHLASHGIENAAHEARLLFCHFGGFSPASLLGEDPSLDTPALQDAVARRCGREPLQYILGEVAFFRESYEVSPDCLIPRADTELLVEEAIARLPQGALFADLCTGSGCIAVSVLANRTDTVAHAYDISEGALALAARNARRNGVEGRLTLCKRDLLREAPGGALYDAILSNPPYIATAVVDTLAPEVAWEPRIALDGGTDGVDFYRAILSYAATCLKKDGFLLLEFGYDQEAAICRLGADCGFSCEVRRDLGGNPRLAYLTRQ